MTLLVTGLSGFVGQALYPYLNRDTTVVFGRHNPFVNWKGLFYQIDLNDHHAVQIAVNKIRPDACIHLAWEGIPNFDSKTCFSNFSNSFNLLRNLAEVNCAKTIVTGTCMEYLGLKGDCNEKQLGTALNLFGRFKHALNLVADDMFANANYHWIRPFYIYGQGQRADSLLPYILREFKSGYCPKLKMPDSCNDYIHVTDVARLIYHLLENDIEERIINAGVGKLFRNSDICDYVRLLSSGSDSAKEFKFPTVPDKDGFFANMSLSNQIGFKHKINFTDGVRSIYEMTDA